MTPLSHHAELAQARAHDHVDTETAGGVTIATLRKRIGRTEGVALVLPPQRQRATHGRFGPTVPRCRRRDGYPARHGPVQRPGRGPERTNVVRDSAGQPAPAAGRGRAGGAQQPRSKVGRVADGGERAPPRCADAADEGRSRVDADVKSRDGGAAPGADGIDGIADAGRGAHLLVRIQGQGHRRSPDRPGSPRSGPPREVLPADDRRDPNKAVACPAGRHGRQPRALGSGRGSRMDIEMGATLLAGTAQPVDQAGDHRHRPSCGGAYDRQTRPGSGGSAAARCARPRPEDRGRRATGQAGPAAP